MNFHCSLSLSLWALRLNFNRENWKSSIKDATIRLSSLERSEPVWVGLSYPSETYTPRSSHCQPDKSGTGARGAQVGRTQPEQAFLGWPSLWLSGWLKMWKVHKLICCQLRKRRRRRNGGKTEEVGRRVTAGFVGGSERKRKKERAMEGGKRLGIHPRSSYFCKRSR